MSQKRKQASEGSLIPSKRTCRVSTTYATGASSIPLNDELNDSDLDVEDCSESLQYLGTVRDQAKGIPWFLGAPDAARPLLSDPSLPAQDENGGHCARGVYVAGTVIGPALPTAQAQYFGGAVVAAFEHDEEDSEDDDGQYDDEDGESDLIVDINAHKLDDDLDRGTYHYSPNSTRRMTGAETDATLKHPRDAYREALKIRFKRLRAALRPEDGNANGFTYSGVRGGKEERVWRDCICKTKPDMRKLRAMPESTVLNLLRILPLLLKRKLFFENANMAINISSWAWTLLAKTSEADEIAYDDVSILRELGKKAQSVAYTLLRIQAADLGGDAHHIQDCDDEYLLEEEADDSRLAHSIESPEGTGELSDLDSDEELSAPCSSSSRRMRNTSSPLMSPRLKPTASAISPSQDHNDELEQRRERLLAAIDAEEEEEPTSAQDLIVLLDMILTVVGDYYGQRDLLNARDQLWSSVQ